MKIYEIIHEDEDYRGSHRAPSADGGAPLHDLTKMYPDDIYGPRAAQYYGHYGQNNPLDMETISKIQRLRGKPTAGVQIYRAVPPDVKEINAGDWVTINKNYAREHGESTLGGEYKILSKIVNANKLYTDGNSIHEWGYNP